MSAMQKREPASLLPLILNPNAATFNLMIHPKRRGLMDQSELWINNIFYGNNFILNFD